MPARTTREQARQRVIAAFMTSLERIIPADESVPLKGSLFRDWEDQAAEMRRALLPTVLEERAALQDNACVEAAGHCPLCGSDSVYLRKKTTRPEVLTPDGPVVIDKQHGRCRSCGGSFPPQNRDWALPGEANLSPRAAERVCREAAGKAFDEAAKSLNIDWKLTLNRKQIQRWSEALGRGMVAGRDRQVQAYREGRYPQGPANAPQLLVIGMDGGRWQGCEKDAQSDSRWREDKVLTVTSYIPGDGSEDDNARKPAPLVRTHLATSRDTTAFGAMARVEADSPRLSPGGNGDRHGRRRELDRSLAGSRVPRAGANHRLVSRQRASVGLRQSDPRAADSSRVGAGRASGGMAVGRQDRPRDPDLVGTRPAAGRAPAR